MYTHCTKHFCLCPENETNLNSQFFYQILFQISNLGLVTKPELLFPMLQVVFQDGQNVQLGARPKTSPRIKLRI